MDAAYIYSRACVAERFGERARRGDVSDLKTFRQFKLLRSYYLPGKTFRTCVIFVTKLEVKKIFN